MGKIPKYILGIGGLEITGSGVYIGLSNKEPFKYSLEWIKNWQIKTGKPKEKLYARSTVILSMMNLQEFAFRIC